MSGANKIAIPLLVLFLAGTAILLYGPVLHLFPSFIHAWTQSDRYAIALRFLDNGFDLFHPATFNYQTVEGITRIDFPVNEYFVALIMKISGSTSPVIFRTYTLCVSIAGLVYLYLLSEKITGSRVKSCLAVLFVFFSPVYFYYQAGFIPSIPAIACLFAGYYYFFSYKDSSDNRQLLVAVLFFLLAALMRFPFIIFLFAVTLQQLFNSVKGRKMKRKELLYLFMAFIIFGAYCLYNIHLGRIYGNMFLDTIMPAKNAAEFREILAEMYHHWFLHYFSWAHYLLLFPVVLYAICQLLRGRLFSGEKKKYWFHLFIAGGGAFVYFLMMARQFFAHDYYFLDSLFVPVALLFVLSLSALPCYSALQKGLWISVLAAFSISAFVLCDKTQEERYSTGPWDRTEITRQNFTGTAAFLDEQGIPKDAKILVIDAYTTNAPLILMNRKGYTVMGTTAGNISLTLAWAKWDYVAIQDAYLVSDVIRSYPLITGMLEKVAGNGKVSFYKRSSDLHPKTLKQFLGVSQANILKEEGFGAGETVMNAAMEYGLTTSATAQELKKENGLKVLVNFDMLAAKDPEGIKLVTSMGEYYQEFILSDYFRPSGGWQHAAFQFTLPEFKVTDEMKVYLWNSAKKDLIYKNWEVVVYK